MVDYTGYGRGVQLINGVFQGKCILAGAQNPCTGGDEGDSTYDCTRSAKGRRCMQQPGQHGASVSLDYQARPPAATELD
ncbi:MAG: hypothetical protein JXA42_06880 [Anaerolineales bacterium]|nr:hypothetical protein [Anaerolineales bacterium]